MPDPVPTPTPAAAPPSAAAPVKPAPPKPAAKTESRRGFLLEWITTAWIAFIASMTAMFLGTLRFLFPNVLSEPPTTFRAGDTSSYEDNKVSGPLTEVA